MGRMNLKHIKFLVLISIGILMSIFPAHSQSTPSKDIEILTVHFPPYSIENPADDRRGYDVEVTELALREAGYNPVYRFQNWQLAVERVQNGDATALLSCTYNQKRAKWIDFSNPISQSTRGFFTTQKNIRLIEPVMLDTIQDYSIASVKDYGTTYELETAGVALKDTPVSDEAAFMALKEGTVDLFYSTKEFGNWFARKDLGFDESLRFYERKGRPYYLCVSQAWPDYEILLREFNKALGKIKQDGRYRAIHAQYQD